MLSGASPMIGIPRPRSEVAFRFPLPTTAGILLPGEDCYARTPMRQHHATGRGAAAGRSEVPERPGESLRSVWKLVESRRRTAYTSLVVPSLSFDADELAKISGVSFYEERLLFTLIRLRDPRARVIYVTSQPIHPEIIEYYLDLLRGVSTRDARSRLHLLPLYDASPLSLTRKILDRPRVVARLRGLLRQTRHGYLTCFNSSPLEAELAAELDLPLNGVAPELLWMGTKSGSRKVFAQAGLEMPCGFEDLRSRGEVVGSLVELARAAVGIGKAVIKLDQSFAGAGNAVFRYPPSAQAKTDPVAIDAALDALEWSNAGETAASYFAKLAAMGGIVEEFVEAEEMRSPSAQLRLGPSGEVELISTHDQILGGPTGQTYLGCRFPADASYRAQIGALGIKIGEVLRDHGVVSRFGVDFLAYRAASGEWRFPAIEINLRMGGTTGPFLALQFLTAGSSDPANGVFRSARGVEKYYVATDNLSSPAYRGLLPEDFMDILASSGIGFDSAAETGAVFHMVGALSQYGKLGVTAISDSLDEAEALYRRVVEAFDRAGGQSAHAAPRSPHPFDLNLRSIE